MFANGISTLFESNEYKCKIKPLSTRWIHLFAVIVLDKSISKQLKSLLDAAKQIIKYKIIIIYSIVIIILINKFYIY